MGVVNTILHLALAFIPIAAIVFILVAWSSGNGSEEEQHWLIIAGRLFAVEFATGLVDWWQFGHAQVLAPAAIAYVTTLLLYMRSVWVEERGLNAHDQTPRT